MTETPPAANLNAEILRKLAEEHREEEREKKKILDKFREERLARGELY